MPRRRHDATSPRCRRLFAILPRYADAADYAAPCHIDAMLFAAAAAAVYATPCRYADINALDCWHMRDDALLLVAGYFSISPRAMMLRRQSVVSLPLCRQMPLDIFHDADAAYAAFDFSPDCCRRLPACRFSLRFRHIFSPRLQFYAPSLYFMMLIAAA